MARTAKLVYFTLVNAILLLLLLELGARLIHKPDPLQNVSSTSVPYQLHPFFQSSCPPSTALSRDPRFHGWPTNPPMPEALEGPHRRILFLGGSTTASRYPHLVRWLLDAQGLSTSAFICGYDWHCSLHSLYKLETYADTVRPDLVIVLEGINDFYRGFTSPALSLPEYREDYAHYAGALHPFWIAGTAREDQRPAFFAQPIGRYSDHAARDDSVGGWFRLLADQSLLLRNIRELAPRQEPQGLSVPMEESVVLRSLPAFERNMRSLARSARRRDIPMVFLTMPWTLQSTRTFLPPAGFFTNDGVHHLDDAGFQMGMSRFAQSVEQIGGEEGVEVISLHKEIEDPGLFTDEVHLNDAGLEQEARVVVRELLARGLVGK